MGSAFDSEVYAERQRLPGVTVSIPRLMQDLVYAVAEKRATLTVEYRGDVETGLWWELRWGEQFAAATTLELCLFRAAVIRRRDDERAKRYAERTERSG